MAINKGNQTNIDKSNLAAYPNGQVVDDDGTGDGFPLIRVTTSDIYETLDKLLRLSGQTYNNEFDNETNGYQFVNAMIALAAKSDYILALGTTSGVLQIGTNLDILQLNEKLICQAVADWTTETQVKGSTATLLNVTKTRSWKANDYLMFIRTSGGVQIVSLVTADNINLIISENAYLKAAANSDEDTGTSVTKATTPASNKYIFTKRVTDPTAAIPYLATDSTPGLMSAADKTALDGFSSPVKNTGWFSGVDAGGGTIGANYTVHGDLSLAVITAIDSGGAWTQARITFANAMTGTNYFVRLFVESVGTFSTDADIFTPTFKPFSATKFDFLIYQGPLGGVQNLKIHCEVVQIS